MACFAALDELREQLRQKGDAGLRRMHRTVASPCAPTVRVAGEDLISFCSNDYLGLANDPRLVAALADGARQWGAGSGASHLVSGHLQPHALAQDALADFVGLPAALLYSTGYLANLGVVPALVGRGDAVFADRLNHASLIDAAQLSRADHLRFPHRDLDALERSIAASTAKRKLILVDAVFSMDGDCSDLVALLDIARRHDAWLVIDDAHGFGVRGRNGRGSLDAERIGSDERIVYVGTLGKAAGLSGAFVAADETVVDWLIQSSRTHIFTTAAIPALSAAIVESIGCIRAGDDRRAQLEQLKERLRTGCAGLKWPLLESTTPIQPLLIGDSHDALRLAEGLRQRGFWVPAIRPPTVPAGTARLRISLSATHSLEQVDALVAALHDLAKDAE